MDALMRPLRIPPEFSRYAEDKCLFELYERMLGELLVVKPKDPLSFLMQFLSRDKNDVHKVIVYGAPASGQHTISKLIGKKLRLVHINPDHVLQDSHTSLGDKALTMKDRGEEISERIWAELINTRLQEDDCLNKGWVLEGFPRTRQQALALQSVGVMAKHFVHLEAPDSVLIERYAGKRIDSLTGDVYHLVFAPPKKPEVEKRLVEEPGGLEKNMYGPLALYHRHTSALLSCYPNKSKMFNADQPINDLFSQVVSFLCTVVSSASPHTPRVILLGPTGSGKSLQAAQMAKKYHLVEVDCRLLLRQTLASGSKVAQTMKPFHDKGMMIPDNLVMPVLSKRLNQLDCVSRGFVMHGFPLNRNQAELLAQSGHQPNRVFFLNISEDSIKERLTLRRIDPESGKKYHLLFQPPTSLEIKERLLTHPRYTEERVLERLGNYNTFIEELVEHYPWGQHINADQDPRTVFECLESALVNPLPKDSLPNLEQVSSSLLETHQATE